MSKTAQYILLCYILPISSLLECFLLLEWSDKIIISISRSYSHILKATVWLTGKNLFIMKLFQMRTHYIYIWVAKIFPDN